MNLSQTLQGCEGDPGAQYREHLAPQPAASARWGDAIDDAKFTPIITRIIPLPPPRLNKVALSADERKIPI